MAWKIILDNDAMNTQSELEKDGSRVGKGTSDYKGGTDLIRVGDDDGNIYYMAVCDGDKGMEEFFNWASYDSGASWSDYWCTKTHQWKGFIS